jgi:rare lipoprotein A
MLVHTAPAQPAIDLGSAGISSSTFALTDGLTEHPHPTRLSVRARTLNVLWGHSMSVAGRLLGAGVPVGLAGRVVTLQAFGRHGWHTIARTRTATRGRYRLHVVARRTGSELLRLRFRGDASDLPSRKRLGRLNVYRLAGASWYGGGGTLACGGALTNSTLGVANKTLPCGTRVTLRYHGRSIRVPVIDRGPYVAGREFDLTRATKEKLGFGDTGEVWSTR